MLTSNIMLFSIESAVLDGGLGCMNPKSDFKMYNKSCEFYHYVRSNIAFAIPSVHRDIRIHLLDKSFSLVEILLSASHNRGNIRNKYVNDLIVCVSTLDFILGECRLIEGINQKKCMIAIKMLTEIKNMAYAWKSNIENGKEQNS